MTSVELEQKLSDLIAFQCILVALRGVGAEASEEMMWQTLAAMLVEQYGLACVWYGRATAKGLCPAVLVPLQSAELEDLPAEIEEASPILRSADLVVPVVVEGSMDGKLVLRATAGVSPERAEQIRILAAEAATMLAERRFRVRTEEALKTARVQAEAANRAKSLLLANMSHEIRTPMTGVLGFADLLAASTLTAEQRDYVETIQSCGGELLTLINDILDFSKIEAGKLELESLPVDIRATVEKAVGLLAVRATEKRLRLTCTFDPSAPHVVLGDSVRLLQILVNLLGNAIKFTSEGEVSISLAGRQEEDGRWRVSFTVRDTGPGIALEHQQRIFESFSQVDASITRKFGGTGLGLAIANSLVGQMGGSMWVESELGRGSAFHFTIVAEEVADRPRRVPRHSGLADVPVAGLPSLRVMVAEDNSVIRKAALNILKRLGYQADSAVNGVEVLDRLAHNTYDVVFMDLQMPELDGLETTRRIRREWPADRRPKIVAMTAAAFPEDRASCLEAGMEDYISKPVDVAELAEVLRRVQPLAVH